MVHYAVARDLPVPVSRQPFVMIMRDERVRGRRYDLPPRRQMPASTDPRTGQALGGQG
jgi:hypothetical protein